MDLRCCRVSTKRAVRLGMRGSAGRVWVGRGVSAVVGALWRPEVPIPHSRFWLVWVCRWISLTVTMPTLSHQGSRPRCVNGSRSSMPASAKSLELSRMARIQWSVVRPSKHGPALFPFVICHSPHLALLGRCRLQYLTDITPSIQRKVDRILVVDRKWPKRWRRHV